LRDTKNQIIAKLLCFYSVTCFLLLFFFIYLFSFPFLSSVFFLFYYYYTAFFFFYSNIFNFSNWDINTNATCLCFTLFGGQRLFIKRLCFRLVSFFLGSFPHIACLWTVFSPFFSLSMRPRFCSFFLWPIQRAVFGNPCFGGW